MSAFQPEQVVSVNVSRTAPERRRRGELKGIKQQLADE